MSKRACCVDSAQELCESQGGRPGLPVPNGPYGLRGRKATLCRGRPQGGGGGGLVVANCLITIVRSCDAFMEAVLDGQSEGVRSI